MACKLYCKYDQGSSYVGSFRNREKAEDFWKSVKTALAAKVGGRIEPIYVETGKGKGK